MVFDRFMKVIFIQLDTIMPNTIIYYFFLYNYLLDQLHPYTQAD
jgi:hypothetical protein